MRKNQEKTGITDTVDITAAFFKLCFSLIYAIPTLVVEKAAKAAGRIGHAASFRVRKMGHTDSFKNSYCPCIVAQFQVISTQLLLSLNSVIIQF